MGKITDIGASVYFEPRHLWIGCDWDCDFIKRYSYVPWHFVINICIIPMFTIRICINFSGKSYG